MHKFVMVPESMSRVLVGLVQAYAPGREDLIAVLKQSPVQLPLEFEFCTDTGDRCRTVAWSREDAVLQIQQDGRFPGNLTFVSSHLIWPGTGVVRVICPDVDEEEI
jgi:hypothetical protein